MRRLSSALAVIVLASSGMLAMSTAGALIPGDDEADSAPAVVVLDAEQAHSEDLLLASEELGISLAEAERRFGWQDKFARIATEVEASFPNAFAGAKIDPSGRPQVSFKGQVPTGVAPRFGGLAVTVDFVGAAANSMTEQDAFVRSVHAAVRGVLPGWEISTAFVGAGVDGAAGSGQIEVDLTPAPHLGESLASLVTLATTSAKAALLTVPGVKPGLSIEVSSSPVTGEDTIRGGAYLTWGSDIQLACTSGWPVRETIGTRKGLITADHCSNSLWYSGRNVLTWRKRLSSNSGDIDYRSSSESVGTTFYYGTGTYRQISGLVALPAVGQRLCKYGRNTKLTCDDVRTRSSCRNDYCSLVMMQNRKAGSGDSGGPWFSGSTAYGVHSGYVTSWFQKRDQWTPIYSNLADLGLALNKG